MRKIAFILFLLVSILQLNAQVKPVYFYGDKVTGDKSKATSYAIYGKLSDQDIWMFKRYDLYDNLLQTGSYSDDQLSIPHGKFIFYTSLAEYNVYNKSHYKIAGKTRFISQEGTFIKGKEEGRWLMYYPDGNVFSYQDFKDGKLEGEFKEFDKFGNVVMEGHFVNSQKQGDWISKKGTKVDTYEKGVLISTKYVKRAKD